MLATRISGFSLSLSGDSLYGPLAGLVVLLIGGILGLAVSVRAFIMQHRIGERTSLATAGIAVSILALAMVVLAIMFVAWLASGIVGPDGGFLA